MLSIRLSFALKTPVIGIIFTCYSCSHETFSGVWQSTPVKVDAKIKEWELPLRFYDNKTKLNYSITNDANDLYICMRAADPQLQTKITQAGMQVWIDTTGKKKKSIGITFPFSTGVKMKYGEQIGSDKPTSEKNDNYTDATIRNDFLAANKEMQVVGFKSPLKGFIPLASDSGINVSMNWDSTNTLIYEARIPLISFYKRTLTLADSLKVFSVGVFVNGVDIISPTSRRGAAGDGAGGAMAGRGMGNGRLASSGFAGSGAGVGGSGNYGSLTQTRRVWTRMRLSVHR